MKRPVLLSDLCWKNRQVVWLTRRVQQTVQLEKDAISSLAFANISLCVISSSSSKRSMRSLNSSNAFWRSFLTLGIICFVCSRTRSCCVIRHTHLTICLMSYLSLFCCFISPISLSSFCASSVYDSTSLVRLPHIRNQSIPCVFADGDSQLLFVLCLLHNNTLG